MNEKLILVRACLANPADKTTRLVLADWIQENGDEPTAIHLRCLGYWMIPDGDGELSWNAGPRGVVKITDWGLCDMGPQPRCVDCDQDGHGIELLSDSHLGEYHGPVHYQWICARCEDLRAW